MYFPWTNSFCRREKYGKELSRHKIEKEQHCHHSIFHGFYKQLTLERANCKLLHFHFCEQILHFFKHRTVKRSFKKNKK